MDIEYLLILQNFREATNNILSPFFLFISNLSIIGVLIGLLLIIIYEKTSKYSWFPFDHVWGMKFSILTVYLMLIWPLVIKLVERKE